MCNYAILIEVGSLIIIIFFYFWATPPPSFIVVSPFAPQQKILWNRSWEAANIE